MVRLTRRKFICTAVVAAAVPAVTVAPATPVAEAAPILPAWVVGTPGEFDAGVYRGQTPADAIAAYMDDRTSCDPCDCKDRTCDYCEAAGSLKATREACFDEIDNPCPADWARAGWGTFCERCDYETGEPQVVGDEAVCIDCMTMADWEIADPERAAEMRADATP